MGRKGQIRRGGNFRLRLEGAVIEFYCMRTLKSTRERITAAMPTQLIRVGCVRLPEHRRNHKMKGEALVALDDGLAELIGGQQQLVPARYRSGVVLFPRPEKNPDGTTPVSSERIVRLYRRRAVTARATPPRFPRARTRPRTRKATPSQ